MYFDRFDICEAYFMFASLYHRGQWSPEYRVFGRLDRMKFKPSPLLSLDSLSPNAMAIYTRLTLGEQKVRV